MCNNKRFDLCNRTQKRAYVNLNVNFKWMHAFLLLRMCNIKSNAHAAVLRGNPVYMQPKPRDILTTPFFLLSYIYI